MTFADEPLRLALRHLALRLADLEDTGQPTHILVDALRVGALRNGADPDVATDLHLTAGLLLVGLDRVDTLRSVWPDAALEGIAASCVQALEHLDQR